MLHAAGKSVFPSHTRLHQLQKQMKHLEDKVQTEHEHAESLAMHEKI